MSEINFNSLISIKKKAIRKQNENLSFLKRRLLKQKTFTAAMKKFLLIVDGATPRSMRIPHTTTTIEVNRPTGRKTINAMS